MKLSRIAYVHAGTHKTGTTSIQALLAQNDEALVRAGIYVPRTGRISVDSAGHHNLAWQLNNNHCYDPACGTVEQMIDEVAAAGLPTVCLSSEEFAFLGNDKKKVRALWDGFRSIGYDPHLVLYLRPQADYMESLFAELIRGGWPIDFEHFAATIVRTGVHVESMFDYARLLRQFDAVFGVERLHVRAYRSAAPADALLEEFVNIIGRRHAVDFNSFRRPARLNRKASAAELAARLGLAVEDATPSEEVDLLTLLELVRVMLAFWPSNDRIYRRYGARVSPASAQILTRELVAALLGDAAARARRLRSRLRADKVAA